MAKTRRPWRKFYPTDYLGDHGLANCSFGAQGLWARLMCLAWLSPIEGHVVKPDGTAITQDDIASGFILSRDTPGHVKRYMEELVERQVCDIDPATGAIVSRRIVRDAERTRIGRETGGRGGNPILLQDRSGTDKGTDNGVPYPRSAYAYASASASGSGGDARGGIDPQDGPSFLAYWYAYPAGLRTKQAECLAAWSECMTEGHDPGMIVAKATEYGESQQGQGEYAVRAPRFLEARMFLDPPEAWADANSPAKRIDAKAIAAKIARENGREH